MTSPECGGIPEHAELVISKAKVRDYLLSPSHSVGRHKARFFRSLGYGQHHWTVLTEQLLNQARSNQGEIIESEYGRKYLFRGVLKGPNGRSATLVSVWILVDNEQTARFVTAYPKE